MINFNDIRKEYPIFTGSSRQGLLKALKIRGCTAVKKDGELFYDREEIIIGLIKAPYRNRHFRPEDGIRFWDCVKYIECLDKAARIDSGLDCSMCPIYVAE